MVTVTVDFINKIAPSSRKSKLVASLVNEMNAQFPAASIDTKEELCHFIAQAAHETASFTTLIEAASGKAYEMRKDLGNTEAGEGVRYKGRGIFQTTGWNNYYRLTGVCPDQSISFVKNPELLQQPKWAVWSALIFWNDRHLSDIAMQPDYNLIYSKYLNKKLTPIEYITFRINGGLNGLDDRELFYERAKRVFT